jgi:hypothetical protein
MSFVGDDNREVFRLELTDALGTFTSEGCDARNHDLVILVGVLRVHLNAYPERWVGRQERALGLFGEFDLIHEEQCLTAVPLIELLTQGRGKETLP